MAAHYTKPAFYVTIVIYSALFAGAVWSFDRDQTANSVSGELSPTISMELLTANVLPEEKVEEKVEEPIEPQPEPEPVKEEPKPEPKQEVVADPTVKKELEQPKKEIERPKKVEKKRKHHHRKPEAKPMKAQPQIQSKAQGAPVTTQQQNLQGLGASSDELAAYRSALRQEIERHKRYSQRARMLRRQGTVVVEFSLMNDGSIQNVRLHRSSGYDELDQLALDAVSQSRSVGARPAGLSSEQKIPIKFMLR
ncbi:TonB family protein [Gallibacterium salpingitidis]|uniref:Protein TonB n=1 Tax=Gallibacterium salpingitidis TaxID=505341 RepID=A0A1A7P122_9PAST|nr:energy transducer TonB [Gallibacterium salpingitidis]OBW95530.1 energy transducer TonB [Gallibacterium salpingitidis]